MSQLVCLKCGQTDGRVYLGAEDPLRRFLRHLLDLHSPLRGGHDDVARGGSIEENRQIELPGDVDALLDIEPVDLLTLFAGLDGDQRAAQHLLRQPPHLLLGSRWPSLDPCADDIDPADVGMLLEGTLAPPSGVYLGLEHQNRVPGLLD